MVALGAALVSPGLQACGDDGDDGAPTSGAGASEPATYADVQQIVAESCAVPTCHAASLPSLGLDLETDPYGATVGVAASTSIILVEPGAPEASYLLEKVSSDTPTAGGRMPPGNPLSSAQIETLRSWIAAGAPR